VLQDHLNSKKHKEVEARYKAALELDEETEQML